MMRESLPLAAVSGILQLAAILRTKAHAQPVLPLVAAACPSGGDISALIKVHAVSDDSVNVASVC